MGKRVSMLFPRAQSFSVEILGTRGNARFATNSYQLELSPALCRLAQNPIGISLSPSMFQLGSLQLTIERDTLIVN